MTKSKLSLMSIIALSGACISFYIGAGFATMQEVVQYDASYGSMFPVVILVTAIIYIYTNLSFATMVIALDLNEAGRFTGYTVVALEISLESMPVFFLIYFQHFSVI